MNKAEAISEEAVKHFHAFYRGPWVGLRCYCGMTEERHLELYAAQEKEKMTHEHIFNRSIGGKTVCGSCLLSETKFVEQGRKDAGADGVPNATPLSDELKDYLERELTGRGLALAGEGSICLVPTQNAIQRACKAYGFVAPGATLEIEGHVKLRLTFPEQDLAIETAELIFDEKLELELTGRCDHVVDWYSFDLTAVVPEIECRLCGKKATLNSRAVSWHDEEP